MGQIAKALENHLRMRGMRSKPRHRETDLHVQFVRYFRTNHPDVLLTSFRTNVNLPPAVAVRLKRMGYMPGMPDVLFPEPRGAFHGLFVELKANGGRLSDIQKAVIKSLEAREFKVLVCDKYDDAIRETEKYLFNGKPYQIH